MMHILSSLRCMMMSQNDGAGYCSTTMEELERCSVVTENAPSEERCEKRKLVEKKGEVPTSQGVMIRCYDWLVQQLLVVKQQ